MTELRELRTQNKLSQRQAAEQLGVSLRSYVTYENDERLVMTPKYRYLLREMQDLYRLDEEHGVLSVEDIRAICGQIFPLYQVEYAFLFGSYAKGTAREESDVDLLVSVPALGLQFYELAERLREKLHKRVDLLGLEQLTGNRELLSEVLKEGIRIYG